MLKVLDGVFTHMGACGMNDLLFTSEQTMFMINVSAQKRQCMVIIVENHVGSSKEIRSAGSRYSHIFNNLLIGGRTKRKTPCTVLHQLLEAFSLRLGTTFLSMDIIRRNGKSIAGEMRALDYENIYATTCGA